MPRLHVCTGCGAPFARQRARQTRCPRCEPPGRDNASPSSRAARDGTGDYDRNRALLLAPGPACALRVRCDGAPATTADHVVPVARGGTNDLSNLQPACSSCNASKQARTKPGATRGPTARPGGQLPAAGPPPARATRLA